MAGHQLYDMMHSLLQSIAAGTVSGSPGSGGPNLQLSPQMMQPMSLVPSTNPQTTPFAPFSMMPYGGLPNFGNTTSGALMPFMAQSSMPSSLPEPQPARAADAAATTPAAASSTNPQPTHTHPQSHSRRSRSRHRRHRHSHSHTSHHRGHDKSPRRHTARRARSSSRRPHHRSRRSRRNPIPLRLTLPPAQVPPMTLPRTQNHGSTSSPANPHLPSFHLLAHFRMGHRQVSMVLSTLVEPIVGTPTAEPQHKPLGQAPPQHQQHGQLEQSGQATVLATAAT